MQDFVHQPYQFTTRVALGVTRRVTLRSVKGYYAKGYQKGYETGASAEASMRHLMPCRHRLAQVLEGLEG